MSTMRAAFINATGSPDELVLGDLPRPSKVNSEFIIEVHAAGVNPIDAKTRSGAGAAAAITSYPAVLGADFSGVVVESPFEAHPLSPGTEVYGMAPVPPRSPGTYAQFTAVQALSVAAKPRSLSHIEAAGVPLAAMTAWGAVVELGRAREGQRVLIHAGSGGVGHFAVQFAAYFGAQVFATGSSRNHEFLRSLGAAEVIDYSTTRFEDVARDMDVVVDLIGNVKDDDTGTRSLTTLRPDGLLVSIPSGSWPTVIADAATAGVRATTYKVSPDARILETITRMIDAQDIRVHIDAVFPLEAAADAHRSLEQGHTRGKIVLEVTGSETAAR